MRKMININITSVYYLAYSVYIASIIMDYTYVSHQFKVVLSAISCCLLLYELVVLIATQNAFKFSFINAVFLLFFVTCSLVTKDYFVLTLSLFAICVTKRIKIDILLKITIFVLIGVSITVVFLCILDIIPNISTPRGIGTGDRFSFGFSHSQNLSLICLFALFCYLMLEKKVRIITLFVASTFFYILYLIVDARTSFYSVILIDFLVFIHLVLVKKRSKKNTNMYYNLMFLIILFYICLNFLLLYLYQSEISIVVWLDKILTTRISSPLLSINSDSFSFFNNLGYIEWRDSLSPNSNMDNGYYYILHRYGYLYLVFLFYVIYLILKFVKNNNITYGLICVLTICVVFSLASTFALFLPFFIISFVQLKFYS